LDLYSLADRRVHRLGALPFSIAHNGVRGVLTVSRDGRWALGAQIDPGTATSWSPMTSANRG
jgi:hypothetical protein